MKKNDNSKKIWDAFVKKALNTKVRILLVGRTGVGKSCLTNSFLGKQVAEVSDFEPTTNRLESYTFSFNNIQFEITDAPGFCDDLPEIGNDEYYLKMMSKRLEDFDICFYVTPLDERRVDLSEKRTIQLLTKKFGVQFWNFCIPVFTFSDQVKPEKYPEWLEKRKQLIGFEIKNGKDSNNNQVPTEIAEEMKYICVSNENDQNPDGSYWRPELLATCIEKIQGLGSVSLYLATKDSIASENISESQNQRIQRTIWEKLEIFAEKVFQTFLEIGTEFFKKLFPFA